ncbi:MAG: leucine-rich repeat protein [Candidatus Methanomethylophilaceae archaeon]|nr:leucine-rich repeat protein [Candidatus Methanomethylophilaceae archaeon]
MNAIMKTALVAILIAAVALTAASVPGEAETATVTVDGIEYSLADSGGSRTATVTAGSIAEMKGDVAIPSSVQYNGKSYTVDSLARGFSGNQGLTSIALPDSVTALPNKCFNACQSLVSATMDGVLTIPEQGFNGCASLRDVSAASATSIKASAFDGCASLSKFRFGSLVEIGNYAFRGCGSMTSFDIPTTAGLGTAPFVNTGIKGFLVSGGLLAYVQKDIGSFTIPASVTTIGPGAFYGVALKSLTVPGTVMTVSDYGFYCSKIESIVFDEDVLGIGSYAFADAAANSSVLKSVKLPTAITIINEGTFSNCSSLTSIDIPKEINAVGDKAFEKCSSLKTVNVSSGIAFGQKAFSRCSSLTSFKFFEGSVAGSNMFEECSQLNSISLCDSMTEIPDYMLSKCKGLTSFEIPSQVKTIGKYAFSNTGLTEIVIPSTLDPDGLGDHAFRASSSLENVTFLGSYSRIPIYCFHSCSSLKTIETYGMLETANSNAFIGCKSLSDIVVHTGVPFKDATMFGSDLKGLLKDGFVSVKSPSGIGTVCVSAASADLAVGSDCIGFSNDALAKTVGSGHSIKSANPSIVCADGAVYLEDELLYVSPSVAEPEIRDGTARIDSLALSSLKSAKTLVIPASVERIDSNAVLSDPALKSVLFYGTPSLDTAAMSLGDAKAYFLDGKYDPSKCKGIALSGYFADVAGGRALFTINDPSSADFSEVHSGSDVAFSVTPVTGYTDSVISAVSGGKAVPKASQGTKVGETDVSGMFILKGVSGETEVVVSGIELNAYDVSCPSGQGYAFSISESKDVIHGSKILFQVRCLPGYQFSPSYAAKVDGNAVQHDYGTSEYRVYSFEILHDSAITVSGVTEKSKVTVSFDTGGGSSVSPQKVLSGAAAEVPAAPTKSGSTFMGWYTSPGFAELYRFGPVEKDTTIYAKWASGSSPRHTLSLSADHGQILAYVNGSASPAASGSKIVSGSHVDLVFVPSERYEAVSWKVNGADMGPSSSISITMDGDKSVSVSSLYHATGSFINSTGMDTPTPSDYASSWIYGSGGTAGAYFKNMVYAPAVVDGYVFAKNDNVLLKIDADDGRLVKSVTTAPSFSGFYEYLAVGGGLVLDCITGKVFDTDLNQLFILSNTTAKAFYHDGRFYVETPSGTACFEAKDSDPSDPANRQNPVWTMDTGSFVTLYEGGTQMLFHNGFVMVCGFDDDGSVYLQTSDAATGKKIDRIYIPEFKGQWSNKGYINIGEGYATVTTYLSGIFDSQKGKINNVASVRIGEDGMFDHATLKVRSNGNGSSYSSALIVNDGLGYVFSDRTFTVYDMKTMDVVSTLDSKQLYAHGSMAISTGHPGKVYAYIVPYVESADLLVVEYDLATKALSVKKIENVAIAQYSSQQVHFLEDGAIIYTNDGGMLYCIRHNVAVSSISLSEKARTLAVGEEFELEASFSPSGAAVRTLEWSTSDADIATVKDGTVRGVSLGTATITAKSSNGRTASCTVTVGSGTIHVASVSLSETSAAIPVGGSVSLVANVSPADATDRSVTWSTSDTKVAAVKDGKVTGLSPGTAVITVTTNDGGHKASCTVTVSQASCTVTWKNWDGSVLSTDVVEKGKVPSYSGATPTRASEAGQSYSFSGWSPAPVAATADAVYTATYVPVAIAYTVTYLPGEHGDFAAQTYTAAYGAPTPGFSGTPSGKPGYSFSGWSPAVSPTVTKSVSYTAQWSASGYKVTYIVDGAAVSAEAHAVGESVKVHDQYVKAGRTSTPWSTSDVSVSGGSFVMPAKDVTFSASTSPIELSVTWKNWDGTVLSTSKTTYGSTPSYAGAAPTRPSSSGHVYVFSGWSPSVGPITSDAVYTAVYKATSLSYSVRYLLDGMLFGEVEPHAVGEIVKVRAACEKEGYISTRWSTSDVSVSGGSFVMPAKDVTFSATTSVIKLSVTWKNWDGSVLKKTETDYGSTPMYSGAAPVKPSSSENRYVFSGWSPSIAPITSDAVYTAIFDSVPIEKKTYQISWNDWDGRTLATTEAVEGTVPTYTGGTPERAPDAQHSYSFSGWSPAPAAAASDATYTATYAAKTLGYSVRYLVDGAQAGEAETHVVGEIVKVRAAYEKEGFVVSAWSTSDAAVSDGSFVMPAKDVTFAATSSPVTFDIQWKNWDGSGLGTTSVRYEEVPAYSGPAPTRPSDGSYDYAFAGWTPAPAKATSDASYTATYTATPAVKHVTGIALDRSSASLSPGDVFRLVATVSPSDASDRGVKWSSSDESVATVDQNGSVKAISPGSATITATSDDGGYTASCHAVVQQAPGKASAYSTWTWVLVALVSIVAAGAVLYHRRKLR